MTPEMKQKIADNRQRFYDALKAADFLRYRNAIHSAEAVTLQFDLPQKVAVEIEAAVVFAVCDALGVEP
jgi:nucleoside phosphorylase